MLESRKREEKWEKRNVRKEKNSNVTCELPMNQLGFDQYLTGTACRGAIAHIRNVWNACTQTDISFVRNFCPSLLSLSSLLFENRYKHHTTPPVRHTHGHTESNAAATFEVHSAVRGARFPAQLLVSAKRSRHSSDSGMRAESRWYQIQHVCLRSLHAACTERSALRSGVDTLACEQCRFLHPKGEIVVHRAEPCPSLYTKHCTAHVQCQRA